MRLCDNWDLVQSEIEKTPKAVMSQDINRNSQSSYKHREPTSPENLSKLVFPDLKP